MWLSNYWRSIAAFALFIGLIANSGALLGIGAFVLLAGVLGSLWSKHAFDRVSFKRTALANRAFPGETVEITATITNDKMLPLPWFEVRDLVPENSLLGEQHTTISTSPGYVTLIRSTRLGPYQRINWPLHFRTNQRGYYRLGPARFNSGDVFGFFPAEKDDNEKNYIPIIVYPRLYELPQLGLPAQRPFGDFKGRERIFEDPGRPAGLRDYRPGDPMRRIDWKATARRQTLQAKVYEPSTSLHMLLAVNVHTLAHTWQGYVPEFLERVLSAAGSIARYGAETGFAVGLVANGSYPGSDRPLRIPAGRRSDQLTRILEALAVIGPLTLTPLETVLDREAAALPYGTTVVCVTSRVDPPLAASLRRIASSGHAVAVVAIGGEEIPRSDLAGVQIWDISEAMTTLEAAQTMPPGKQTVAP